jgi:sortase A
MKPLPRFLITVGLATIGASLLIVGLTIYPVIREEIRYAKRQKTFAPPEEIIPVNTSFGIIIPKIGANAHVIANVNPYDAREYQQALTRGVAHARGSSLPNTSGNVFLFSHSSVDFYLASQYNSIFYLIDKLEKGDEIDIYYQDTQYSYRVTDKKIINPTEISYLTHARPDKTLTLMTCWPPGTSFRRLIVLASLPND